MSGSVRQLTTAGLDLVLIKSMALFSADLALRGLLGEEVPVSSSTAARLKERWQVGWEQWKQRQPRGAGSRLPVGGRGICKGGPGEREGGAAGCHRWLERWAEGSPGSRAGLCPTTS